MKKTLIVFAHPNYAGSKANRALIDSLPADVGITVHNICEAYPDGTIDVAREQALLSEADKIVLQFPTFWFNMPGALKNWFDQVLTYGWAYGPGGTALAGKEFVVATTTGGTQEAYSKTAGKGLTVEELLVSVIGSIGYVGGNYQGFSVLYNAMAPSSDEIASGIAAYQKLILA